MRYSRVLSVAAALATILPAQEPTENARRLVQKLELPLEQEIPATERQLIALGKAAVAPLLEALESAQDNDAFAARILHVLEQLGPDGGTAVPKLTKAVENCRPPVLLAMIRTIGTLTPFRAAGVDVRAFSMHLSGRRPTDGVAPIPVLDCMIEFHRVSERSRFELRPDQDMLLRSLDSYRAYRVELAIEWLARSEPQPAALPGLLRILQRPDPRIALADRTVPLRAAAATEILRITPTGDAANLARGALAGAKAKSRRPIPNSAKARIAELISELQSEEQVIVRRAAENLYAYGAVAIPALAAALPKLASATSRSAALEAIRKLGKQGAGATLALGEVLVTYPAEHTVEVLDALTAIIPWSRDVLPTVTYSFSLGDLSIYDIPIEGDASAKVFSRINLAYKRFVVAAAFDANSNLHELERLLEADDVHMRELALRILGSRRAEAEATIASLLAAMRGSHPQTHLTIWNEDGSVSMRQVSRDEHVHRLAAEAILAVVPKNAEATAEANAKLAELHRQQK